MDKLAAFSTYAAVYMANATQLDTYRLAREWMETMDFRTATREQLERHAERAATWASIGMLPTEALPLIAAGVSPAMVVATDPQTDAERTAYLANRIQMLGND